MKYFLHTVELERESNTTLPPFERDASVVLLRQDDEGSWWCTAKFETKDGNDVVTVQQVYSKELVGLLEKYLGDLD